MHIFKERYFNINRRFLICLGLWPYEKKTKKYATRAIIVGLLMLFSISQLASIIVHYNDVDRVMLSIVCFLISLLANLKILGMILAEENMTALHRSMANNWQRIQDHCERDILHKYSERARCVTVLYVALLLPLASFASSLPLAPKILDSLRPLENPRPDMYITQGEFFIDRETHFLPLFFADYIFVLMIVLIMITTDTMYIVSVEHCCALYAIIRSRLLKLKHTVERSSAWGEEEDIDSYEWLCRIIQFHQEALTFTSLLNASFSSTFLFLITANLYIIPLSSCAIIANLDTPLHLVPYVSCLLAVLMHGFFFSSPGQRIIDHQLSILHAAYYNEWYATPLCTRKLLLIFMQRCSNPAMITAGNLLPVNFQIYFTIFKTSVSYITVAASFR